MEAPGRDTFAGRVLRRPLDALPQRPLWILTGPLRGKRWVANVSDHSYLLGNYERDKQHRFASSLRRGDLVFDLGAHLGFYSLLACAYGARLVAVEPDPTNAGYIRQHLSLNGFEGTVLEAAISRDDTGGHFNRAGGSMGALSDTGVDVQTRSLDSLSKTYGYPDVLKIDIEGAELEAVPAGLDTLRHARTIFLAVHSDAIKTECAAVLLEAGFTVGKLGDPHELVGTR